MTVILPLTNDPRQIFTLDLTMEGVGFHGKVEVRYLSAPDVWVISIWDHASGKLMVNQIPLICSYGEINDLLRPFRHLRDGKGLGAMYVLRAVDEPGTADPGKNNLNQFQVLWGDIYE